MSPQDKLAAIARQAAAGHKVLMIGDGLNDGPALAAGYASIAPGSASDAGKNAADCIFLGDRLMPVMLAIRVARRTQAIVRQNFALVIGHNIISVPLAFMGSRSEEHTSELQSLMRTSYDVFCMKKKKDRHNTNK